MNEIAVSHRIYAIAEELARMSEHHFKVGAVIVKGKKIISAGFNKNKTHTIIKNKIDKYSLVDKLHAEMNAILKARTNLNGTKIYVLRSNKNHTGMAKPCELCMRLIRVAGIKEIIFTTGNLTNPWMREKIINVR